MNTPFKVIILSAAMATLAVKAMPQDIPSADLAVAWNELIINTAVADDGLATIKGSRAAAMMHLAMHDALANLDRRYAPYLFSTAPTNADPIAATNQAAFAVAVDLYPDQYDAFKAEHSKWMKKAGKRTMQESVDLGNRAAKAILADRKNDGWDTETEYTWHPMGPGVYADFNEHSGTPEGFIFGAGVGKARTFMIERADQFVSPPPPAIDSEEYSTHFEEVKSVGAYDSDERTADQTHLALWWKDFVENSHSRLARDLVMKEELDLVDSNRLFALLTAGVFDAYVSSFYNKFLYNHWRPYTAIRWAEHDENPDTEPDVTWNNTHKHTYAFPSYPSAHGTACAAAMSAFTDTFGDNYAFTMSTPYVDIAGMASGKMKTDPPTRSFNSFSEAALECAMSRVYLGIHFRYDSVEGNVLGSKIGEVAVGRLARK